jgi:hypothetical protein
MKKIFYLCFILIITSCLNKQKTTDKKAAAKKPIIDTVSHNKFAVGDTIGPAHPEIKYSDKVIEAFLDSVGHLPAQPLADKAAFGADSIFKSQIPMDSAISQKDFEILKKAANKGVISVKTAMRIFNNKQIDYSCNEKSIFLTYKFRLIPVVFYPFGKNKFDEFAICIGDPEHCPSAFLYFFKGNKIIARHAGFDRDGLDLKYFKDIDGKTVVYYRVEFTEGSGIWWYNFFFYKYDGDKIIPVLNELQNANLLQPSPWGARELWLESTVQKTNPLTIKMVYHQKLPDTLLSDTDNATRAGSGPMIVNDSTIVKYVWNEKTKTLDGQFAGSKITRAQILSYYLIDNERLFINANYKKLKALLLDKTTRKATLNYINLVKNYSK